MPCRDRAGPWHIARMIWSHVAILIGRGTMMLGWWRFYELGYPGVREALAALG